MCSIFYIEFLYCWIILSQITPFCQRSRFMFMACMTRKLLRSWDSLVTSLLDGLIFSGICCGSSHCRTVGSNQRPSMLERKVLTTQVSLSVHVTCLIVWSACHTSRSMLERKALTTTVIERRKVLIVFYATFRTSPKHVALMILMDVDRRFCNL